MKHTAFIWIVSVILGGSVSSGVLAQERFFYETLYRDRKNPCGRIGTGNLVFCSGSRT